MDLGLDLSQSQFRADNTELEESETFTTRSPDMD